ncbi:MAG TPA: Type 1 glutamine amidotransferase-like domain-containing protein [Anaerolineae bacterium]|nr:Type 1 glutamine amidotransferase-like domain-containing protein [Anaerolineae bacterium]
MAGTLALVGAGEFLETMSDVDRVLLDRAGGKQVAIVPTASAPDGRAVFNRWLTMGVDHFTRLGASATGVPAFDRADCENAANADIVRGANLVYFSGGKPDYLYNTLVDTPLWAAVQQVFDRGGVVAGCSAGAMIMGGHVPDFSSRFGVPSVSRWQAAFGLIAEAIIVPHYNEFPELLINLMFGRRPAGSFLIGVDAHTALIGLNGGTWQAIGAGRVSVRHDRHVTRYTAGQTVSLNRST